MKKTDQELLEKFGVSESWIEESARTYEMKTWNSSEYDGPIFHWFPLDRVGTNK